MTTLDLAARLTNLKARIDAATAAASRPAGSVRVILATKTLSLERTLEAVHASSQMADGVLLGESRVQEITAKGPALAALGAQAPRVHLIGHLQTNKINAALPWVDCIESIDSLRLATRVSDRVLARAESALLTSDDGASEDASIPPRRLDVFLQVNVSGEDSKFGISPQQAPELAEQVAALAGLRLGGFMTIGANSTDDDVRAGYERLREIRDVVVSSGAPGTEGAIELSMGMSHSLEAAIAEGATIVRVGRAVFGERPT